MSGQDILIFILIAFVAGVFVYFNFIFPKKHKDDK